MVERDSREASLLYHRISELHARNVLPLHFYNATAGQQCVEPSYRNFDQTVSAAIIRIGDGDAVQRHSSVQSEFLPLEDQQNPKLLAFITPVQIAICSSTHLPIHIRISSIVPCEV